MVNPLQNFSIVASKFGGELIISWKLPSILPASYKVFVFKRSGQDVTQQEIDNYFANIDDLSNFNYNGLMVYDSLDKDVTIFGDYVVKNGITYYYKAVVRDQTTEELSAVVSGNATPEPELKLKVKDGKKIVKTAIEKMLDNIYSSDGRKVQLGKDISISTHFSMDVIDNNYIMIERVNGATAYQFYGNELQRFQGGIIKGDIDTDVIRATFITQETPDRRDTVANIFRANKQTLIKFCKALGATDCKITIEGDYYNPQIHGVNATGFNIVFSLLITNKAIIPDEVLTTIFEELRVVNE